MLCFWVESLLDVMSLFGSGKLSLLFNKLVLEIKILPSSNTILFHPQLRYVLGRGIRKEMKSASMQSFIQTRPLV